MATEAAVREPLRPALPEGGIESALAAADLALAEQRLAFAEGSALGLYLSVLDVEPGNTRALAGKAAVLAALGERARAQLAEGALDDASRAVELIARFSAGTPDIERLIAELARAVDIRDSLARAESFARDGVFFGPDEHNAHGQIAGLLVRYPDLPEASAAMVGLQSRVVARVEGFATEGRFGEADDLLGEAAGAWPGSAVLQDAGARVQELRHLRASRLLGEAGLALDRGDADAAERILAQMEGLVAQQEEVDELRLRIDSVRLYGGHLPGQLVRDPLTRGGRGPEMVVLPVGGFRMGAGQDDSARRPIEGPVRSVQFAKGFLLARTEVSVGQFRLFVTASGYRPTSSVRRRSTVYDEKSGGMVERRGVTWEDDFAGHRADDDLPVVHVSWEDAHAYAAWLAMETGLAYRLPSEAEFEYALRAGSTSAYPWGEGVPHRPIANLTGENDRSGLRRQWANAFRGYGDGFWGPAPVAAFDANAFGVHDLLGNVSEWVEDCWHDSFSRAPRDGSAWVNPGCGRRVYRGSSWASAPEHSRSAFRSDAAPETTHGRLGFRVSRPVAPVLAGAAGRE